MNDQYTPEELLDYANDMEQDGLSTGAAMLRQAATDATRLQSLEAENARLREALAPFVKHYDAWMDEHGDDEQSYSFSRHTFGQLRFARNALKED